LNGATQLVRSRTAGHVVLGETQGGAASVAEGATMSDAFGVAGLVDICRESERRGDARRVLHEQHNEERDTTCLM
jgi:hypothetical protein